MDFRGPIIKNEDFALPDVPQIDHVHRRTGNFLPGGAVIHSPKKFFQVAQIFTKQSKGN